jgi:hypothetical protein
MRAKAARAIGLLELALADRYAMEHMMLTGGYTLAELQMRTHRSISALRLAGELMHEMAAVAVVTKARG